MKKDVRMKQQTIAFNAVTMSTTQKSACTCVQEAEKSYNGAHATSIGIPCGIVKSQNQQVSSKKTICIKFVICVT
jgi:hypothetical protein